MNGRKVSRAIPDGCSKIACSGAAYRTNLDCLDFDRRVDAVCLVTVSPGETPNHGHDSNARIYNVSLTGLPRPPMNLGRVRSELSVGRLLIMSIVSKGLATRIQPLAAVDRVGAPLRAYRIGTAVNEASWKRWHKSRS